MQNKTYTEEELFAFGTSELVELVMELQKQIPADNEMIINMSHVCELAHELTRLEADGLGLGSIDSIDSDGNTTYTKEAQPVFDQYYDLITNTLNF